MKKLVVYFFYVFTLAGSASCTYIYWLPDERSGLGRIDSRLQMVPSDSNDRPNGIMLEKTISVPLDAADRWRGVLDLYYFVRMPKTGKAIKTVLFCAGGPGQFIPGPTLGVTFADFLTNNGYNVVYFHPRGVGFSQIPSRNTYDRFLKTSYVLDDIEAIRKDFLGGDGKWNAVIGYSFGAVVAQEYAGTYNSNLDRLILLGPQSRQGFQNPPGVFDQITGEIRDINRKTLGKIFQRPEFSNLTPTEKSLILNTVLGTNIAPGISPRPGIFQRAEENFGSLAFVISAYCDLKAKNELASHNLDYSRQFFRALRGLRDVGWFPPLSRQVDYGKTISDAILPASGAGESDCDPDVTGSSDRVFYVVSFYDGINLRFLSKWLANGKSNVWDAVIFSAGEVQYLKGGINKYVVKVGISNSETIEPWDPARYQHNVTTMILKGTADTVTAGGAAEYIFGEALSGSRTLMQFPGIGHLYLLPALPNNFQSGLPGNPAACAPKRPIRDCLIYSFVEMIPAEFNNSAVNRLLEKQGIGICHRDPSLTQTRQVAGTCP